MRGVQVSPKHPACPSHLRVLLLGKAYRDLRAPWGQTSQRALRLVSWDYAYGRLNLVAAALAVVALVGFVCPPWLGAGS